MSLADRLTQRSKQTEYYSDFLINLDRNPISGELARVNNERAIIRALKALIMTDRGERPFEPDVGCNIRSLLFEPMDDPTVDLLKSAITTTIAQHEPRVVLQLIDVVPYEEENHYEINVTFSMVNDQSELMSFSTILKRIR